MADFKKLSEVATIEEVADTSYVLIEENGEIYRAPKTEVGGAGGSTLVITGSDYLDAIASYETGVATASELPPAIEYTANMTLDEAVYALRNRELTGAVAYIVTEAPTCIPVIVVNGYAMLATGANCLLLGAYFGSDMVLQLFWTADGIFTEPPSSGK